MEQIHFLHQVTNLHRIRLSAAVLMELSWPTDPEFGCFGFFRHPGELLCAPATLRNDDESHPFEPVLRFRKTPRALKIQSISEVPDAAILAARHRIIEFTAKWTSDKRSQLDLQIGVEVTRRLGWSDEPYPSIVAATWAGVLVLMSQAQFVDTQDVDITKSRLSIGPTDD